MHPITYGYIVRCMVHLGMGNQRVFTLLGPPSLQLGGEERALRAGTGGDGQCGRFESIVVPALVRAIQIELRGHNVESRKYYYLSSRISGPGWPSSPDMLGQCPGPLPSNESGISTSPIRKTGRKRGKSGLCRRLRPACRRVPAPERIGARLGAAGACWRRSAPPYNRRWPRAALGWRRGGAAAAGARLQ